MLNKIVGVEFYRVFFTIFIITLHFDEIVLKKKYLLGGNGGGYIGVEFFFILSGFFIYIQYINRKDNLKSCFLQAVTYTKKRIKKIYFQYIIAFIFLLLFQTFNKGWEIKEILKKLYDYKYEIMLLQMSGVKFIRLNTPTWYLSVLIIVGYFIYYLLCRDKDLFLGLIAPLIIFFGIAYFTQINKSIGANASKYNGLIIIGWLRGFIGLSLGVYVSILYQKMKSIKFGFKIKLIGTLVEILCLFYSIMMLWHRYSREDIFSLFIFSLLILIVVLDLSFLGNIYRNSIFEKIGSYTLIIFLNHRVLSQILSVVMKGKNYYIIYLTFIILNILLAIVLLKIERVIKEKLKNIN